MGEPAEQGTQEGSSPPSSGPDTRAGWVAGDVRAWVAGRIARGTSKGERHDTRLPATDESPRIAGRTAGEKKARTHRPAIGDAPAVAWPPVQSELGCAALAERMNMVGVSPSDG